MFRSTYPRGARQRPSPWATYSSGTNRQPNHVSNRRSGFIVGYNKLKQWSEMEKELLATELFGKKQEFGQVINKPNVKEDWVQLSITIFSKIVQSSASAMKKAILKEVADNSIYWSIVIPKFLQKKSLYCLNLSEKKRILEELMMVFLEYYKCFHDQRKNLPFSEIIKFAKALGDTQHAEKVQVYWYSHKNSSLPRSINGYRVDNQTPPNDFRQLPTFPTMDEMLEKTPTYLRPIRKKGCYNDNNHYLDVQFRLLKEDLVYPLREGLRELTTVTRDRNHDLKVYTGIELVEINCTNSGLTFTIKFDIETTQGIFWKHTKKLIYGSLVCISNDHFKTMVFASVANRDPQELQQGLLDVRFLDGLQTYNYFRSGRNKPCEMVECPSYFEAYKHVLDGLKETEDNIPMQEYIVECSTQTQTPNYVKRSTVYSVSNIMKDDGRHNSIQILKKSSWAAKEDVIFNPSQYEAYKHALTNKFSVVQGPPGTGKTFVALKIVDSFLNNKYVWQMEGKGPMLIVCYTNHALDQFLNGLIKHGHRNIVRVGGRADASLEAYLLKTKLQQQRLHSSKESSRYIRTAKYKSHKARESIEEMLDPHLENLNAHHKRLSNGKLLQFDQLENFIYHRHLPHFKKYKEVCRKSQFSVFEIFLGIFDLEKEDIESITPLKKENATVASSQHFQINEATSKTSEGLVDIEGEGEALVDRWAIDENQFKRKKKSKEKKLDEEFEHGTRLQNEDGFIFKLPSKRERKRRIRNSMKTSSPMEEREVMKIINPWSLQKIDRWRLYQYYVTKHNDYYFQNISDLAEEFEDACESLKELKEQEDEQILRKADVIAMTTTCAARYRRILKNIGPRIVVIEEAAEVLEAHVVTSLTPSAEHVVLIGDHKQLRPNPSVHLLAKKYNLELSLFERMIDNGLECKTLNVQHRMRPQISTLIRNVYPDLRDHPKVKTYPHVMGVEKNVVFISHNELEQQGGQKSKANKHEANFIVSLCRYLLQQGYQPGQITVLTGYSGQLSTMKKIMPRQEFNGVRVTTVDNFQGEENDIILLSLVRSNANGSIGFLGTENRVNVALSRARHGLYVIGNFNLLEEKTQLWRNIVGDCRKYDYLATRMVLCCQLHCDFKTIVSKAEDFNQVPDGGCAKACRFRMKCQHLCPKKCHPVDPEHQFIKCLMKCSKACSSGHPCPQQCHYGKKCAPCFKIVRKEYPECGHVVLIECSKDINKIRCKEQCERNLHCGHSCNGSCGYECTLYTCKTLVQITLQKCGHRAFKQCFEDDSNVLCNSYQRIRFSKCNCVERIKCIDWQQQKYNHQCIKPSIRMKAKYLLIRLRVNLDVSKKDVVQEKINTILNKVEKHDDPKELQKELSRISKQIEDNSFVSQMKHLAI